MFREILFVGAGGFAGSALRYAVGRWMSGLGGSAGSGVSGVSGVSAGSGVPGVPGVSAGSVGTAMPGSDFPWGTLTVNVVGCLMIGLIYALAERGNLSTPGLRLLVAAGFCGGFTTFSAFMSENLAMLRAGDFLPFALYVTGSLLLGLGAVWLGWWLVRPA